MKPTQLLAVYLELGRALVKIRHYRMMQELSNNRWKESKKHRKNLLHWYFLTKRYEKYYFNVFFSLNHSCICQQNRK